MEEDRDYGLHDSDDNCENFDSMSQLSKTSDNVFDYLVDRLLDENQVRSRRNSLSSVVNFKLRPEEERGVS